MKHPPDPAPGELRRALSALEGREQKIVMGLFALMIREPARAREREWVSEQLTRVAVMAGDFPADTPMAGVDAVRAYLRERAESLLRHAYLLFLRVGLDLAPRAAEGFDYEDAMGAALVYLAPVAEPPERNR